MVQVTGDVHAKFVEDNRKRLEDKLSKLRQAHRLDEQAVTACFSIVDSRGDRGVLGEGSYGRVLRCRRNVGGPVAPPPDMPDTVAVKQIRKATLLESRKSVDHLHMECAVLSALSHPNIVRLREILHSEDSVYLVLDLCGGVSLQQFVTKTKFSRLPPNTTVRIMRQVLSALDYMHSLPRMPIVHRDVKPENILVDLSSGRELRTTLVDFGFAKVVKGGGEHPTKPMMSTPIGSVEYAPLQLLSGIADTSSEWCTNWLTLAKGDIYSAGACAFVCLTGQLPYTGKAQADDVEEAQRRQALMACEPLVWPKFASKVPGYVRDAVAFMMHNSVEARPTAAECLRLEWFAGTRSAVRASAPLVEAPAAAAAPAAMLGPRPTLKAPPPPVKRRPAQASGAASAAHAQEAEESASGSGSLSEDEGEEVGEGTADPEKRGRRRRGRRRRGGRGRRRKDPQQPQDRVVGVADADWPADLTPPGPSWNQKHPCRQVDDAQEEQGAPAEQQHWDPQYPPAQDPMCWPQPQPADMPAGEFAWPQQWWDEAPMQDPACVPVYHPMPHPPPPPQWCPQPTYYVVQREAAVPAAEPAAAAPVAAHSKPEIETQQPQPAAAADAQSAGAPGPAACASPLPEIHQARHAPTGGWSCPVPVSYPDGLWADLVEEEEEEALGHAASGGCGVSAPQQDFVVQRTAATPLTDHAGFDAGWRSMMRGAGVGADAEE
eukprot:TRINITY_DN3464_c2_g1_i2.p1 TRINITY_DN3464_c2_g1~~TRINITY_DN3464_c2_g1_i2.p1  ORF type:complete len:716 (+),score=127.79 TRINITY_DN3464_c2_g1_i2:81-2228(+)